MIFNKFYYSANCEENVAYFSIKRQNICFVVYILLLKKLLYLHTIDWYDQVNKHNQYLYLFIKKIYSFNKMMTTSIKENLTELYM